MAEVFTISDAFGAPAACPPGWKATRKGNCGGTRGRSPAAMALQSALIALGQRIRDPILRRGKPDGIVGPQTAAMVNRAFTKHIGPGQAPAAFRTGRLTRYQVAQHAGTLTQLIQTETARRGGAAPTPSAVRATRAARAACPAGWRASARGNCSGPAAMALQRALVSLGRATRDSSLSRLKVDGVIGPGTSAAVHRALTVHLRLTVPKFSIYNIANNVQNIINQINRELTKRAKTSAPAASMAARCPTGWRQTRGGNCKGAPARAVQEALALLGRAVRDPVLLKIKADGVIGPATAAAVNRAFLTHVGPGQAPADLRTGRLTIFDVAAKAQPIVAAIKGEIVRRGGARAITERPTTTTCPPGWSMTPAGNCKGAGAVALQKSLAALGAATGDATLRRVRADGVIGPATLAAVKRAIMMVPSDPARPHIEQFKTAAAAGNFTRWTVARNSDALTQVFTQAAAQRRAAGAAATTAPPRAAPPRAAAPPEGRFPDQPQPDIPGYEPPKPPPPEPIDDSGLFPPYTPPQPTTTTTTPPPGPWRPPEPTPPWPQPPGPWAPPDQDGGVQPSVAPEEPAGKPFPWKWVAIGGGAVVAAGAAYALVRGRGGSDRREAPRAAPQPRPRASNRGRRAAMAGALGGVTAKDFRAIADILCQSDAPPRLVSNFSSWLRTQNPRFDVGRFEQAATSCRR